MGVKLVALDIDGTVLKPHSTLPTPRMVAAVRGLHERGIVVVLASGRMFPGAAAIARLLDVTAPLICQQGATIQTRSGETLHDFPLDRHLALDVIEFARHNGHIYAWSTPARHVATIENEETGAFCRASMVEPEYMAVPESLGGHPTCIDVISTRELAPDVHRHLAQIHAGQMHFIDFPAVTVAVANDASKGHALALLCADLGIGRHEVIAAGDSVNDASMLAWAGRGFTFGHGDSYARAAADEVLPDRDESLAELLDSIP